jgi:hypothetical protein
MAAFGTVTRAADMRRHPARGVNSGARRWIEIGPATRGIKKNLKTSAGAFLLCGSASCDSLPTCSRNLNRSSDRLARSLAEDAPRKIALRYGRLPIDSVRGAT